MRMNFLNDALGRVPEYRAIENAVRQRKTPVAVTGLASIHKASSSSREAFSIQIPFSRARFSTVWKRRINLSQERVSASSGSA